MAEENGCDSCGKQIDRSGDWSFVICKECLGKLAKSKTFDDALYKLRLAWQELEQVKKPKMVMQKEFDVMVRAFNAFLLAYYG